MTASYAFDGATKLITVSHDGPTTVASWAAMYSAWKRWVRDDDGAQWDEAFGLSVGGNDLGDGISLDGYFFLRNDLGWRVIPADIDHTLVMDGNGFGFSPSTAVYVTRPGRTIAIRERQSSRSQVIQADASLLEASAAFSGDVWIDGNSPQSGTEFPNGASVAPVNNLGDALAIAATYGLRGIKLLSDLTLSADLSGYHLVGFREGVTVDLNGMDVSGSVFDNVILTGATVSPSPFQTRNSHLHGVTGLHGTVWRSSFLDTTTLAGDLLVARGFSGEVGAGSPVFNLDSLQIEMQVRQWAGSIEIQNMVSGVNASLDLVPGRLIINADCTGGQVKLRGIGEPLEDNSGLVAIDDDGFSIDYERIRDDVVPHVWAARRPI